MFGQGLNFGGLTGGGAPFDASYLLVGGGGGAGLSQFSQGPSGGGGAGGYKEYTSMTLNTATAINVTIGVGGAGSTVATVRGGTGGLTRFDINTVAGGGGGGSSQDFAGSQNGGDGASGGGGGGNSATTTGGAATPAGQGNAGGAGQDDAGADNSGGGGGASGAGGAATSGAPGNGGAGTTTSLFTSGLNIERSGGGGGSNGNSSPGGSATGGGGTGATAGAGTGGVGIFNTGGGAGGSSAGNGANGGSGTVILRYPTADVSSFAVTGTLDTVANTAYPIANKAYYKLNSNANDSSGNGYNGTASNVTYAAGRFGNAAVFNGSSSYVRLPNDLINSNDFTVSLWVNPSSLGSYKSLFGAYGSTPGVNYGWVIYLNNGVVKFLSYSTNGDMNFDSTTTLSVGSWYNVVVTYNSNNCIIYINGANSNSAVPPGNRVYKSNHPYVLGANDDTGSIVSIFDGKIDQVRIFNSALSAGNVTSLYNEGTVVESTDGNDSILQFTGGSGDITFS